VEDPAGLRLGRAAHQARLLAALDAYGGELGNSGFPMRDIYLRVLFRFAAG
jgi:hypothetical protein